jgi:wyosine [tRNA(Phe)-imidazoG37] synthetase (radical SAM superfamily)
VEAEFIEAKIYDFYGIKENVNNVSALKMASYTCLSCQLVSKPGINTQGPRQKNVR